MAVKKSSFFKIKHPRLVIASILFLLTIPASLPLILPGFYEPHDLHHFADIYQIVRALQSGQLPPRLGPDFIFGYGYPLFNFYYVWPFYLGAFFFFLLGSLTTSFKLVFLTSVFLSIFGMYLFLREFVGKWGATAGSILFLYSPYRAVQLYVRGAMGEAFALSFLPFVLWGVIRIIKNPKSKKLVVGVSIITAAFILSHNYLWVLALPWVLLLALLLIKEKKKAGIFNSLLVAALLSLSLTIYWWLPALLENKLVSSITPFPLIDHFPFIRQLIIPSWGYGSSVWGPGDEISFQIGLVNLAVVGFILLVGLYKVVRYHEFILGSPLSRILKQLQNDKKTLLVIWALIGFFICFFMMNIRSYFIWRVIPFHNFIQFPWRFLIFTTLFSSVLSAILVEISGKTRDKPLSILIITAGILLTIGYFKPSQIFYKSDDKYLARFFADRTITGTKDEVSEEYLQYSEDYLLLPKWTEERPTSLPKSKIEIVEGDGQVLEVDEINSVHFKAGVAANSPLKLRLNTLFFPGWSAKVDGKETSIYPGKPYGQIEIEIPKGSQTIEFFWRETKLRRVADYISLTALIGVFVILLYPFRTYRS